MNPYLLSGRLMLLLTLLSIVNIAYSQKSAQQLELVRNRVLQDAKVASVMLNEERQTPSFISYHQGQGYPKTQALSILNNYLNTRAGLDEIRLDRIVNVTGNYAVMDFKQFYKGVRVEYSRFTGFVSNNVISFFNGSWYEIPASLKVIPGLDRSQALETAKRSVNARKYAWEKLEEMIGRERNMAIKTALESELETYRPKGELVIVKDFTKQGLAEMRLAYKFDIYAIEPQSRAFVYVDAENGRILFRDEIIKHAENPGTPSPSSTSVTTNVQTRYSGLRSIKTKQVSGNDPNTGLLLTASNPLEIYIPGNATYALIDDSKGNGIETYDLNGVGGLPISLGPAYSQGKSFTDINNDWTLAEHRRGGVNEAENDDIAWDAHWGAGVVYDYWKAKHNRLSFDGNNAKIKSFIHSGIGYDNAFWNGSVMTYGDGSYPAPGGFRPLTSLDVCGHEIGHGVCTFTADLVYEKESGAMNEGYSDIWAACVEYFAIKNIDATLVSVYKPFYIGEQIAADPAAPLRRMDNPKAAGDPDTYGGANWRDPNCTPTLANDQCGVHTNSGVLNKWFYLMTVGSGAGSGPDAAFAGEDDGVNDLGNSYSITGLGFDLSERIAYLTELMLTSTATFAEARTVSIQVAGALSGNPCSNIVKSVTDAWYAVGVGDAFVQPCTITYGFLFQPGSHVSEGQAGSGCTVESEVSVPFVLPANASASITISGTATQGIDYRLSATSFSNNTSSPAQKTVSVYVKNDGVVELDETVVLSISITNLGNNPVNNIYTLNIVEDDVVPVFSSDLKSLLNETFTGADGFQDPQGWSELLEVPEEPNGTQAAKGKNQWGIFGNKLAVTGRDELTGIQFAPGTYNNNSISQTVIKSPFIDARGLNNLQLRFDFSVQGEVDPNSTVPDQWPALDYMAVVYSFNGTEWFELGQPPYVRFASATPESGTFDHVLPSFLNNKQFYLGFRWVNDPLVGGPVSVSIDNLSLQGSGRKIESELNDNSRVHLNKGQEVYFYSVQDGEIINKIKNNSTKDYGCTNSYIERTGNGSFNLYQGRDGLHKVADKISRIEVSYIYKGSNTVTLYYTEQELQALELATGQNRTSFSVYHVSEVAYNLASARNTKTYPPVYTPLPGAGGSFSITMNDKLNGSYALGYAVSVLGNNAQDYSITEIEVENKWKFAPIYPNPGNGTAFYMVTSPEQKNLKLEIVNIAGQLVYSKMQQIQPGLNQIKLPFDNVSQGSYLVRLLSVEGRLLNAQTFIKK